MILRKYLLLENVFALLSKAAGCRKLLAYVQKAHMIFTMYERLADNIILKFDTWTRNFEA